MYQPMQIQNISVDVRLYYTKDGKRKGNADVLIVLGADGAIPIEGYAIDLSDEKQPRIYPPCYWQDKKKIELKTPLGRINSEINLAILQELERQLETAAATK
jgi:hypothetical protein